MPQVNDKFAVAMRALLDETAAPGSPHRDAECTSPAQARQMEHSDLTVARATAETLGLPFAEKLAHLPVSHSFLQAVPIAYARRHGLIGLAGENGDVSVALADLAQWPHLQTLGKILDKRVRPILAPREEILRTINAAYQQQAGQTEQVIQELDGEALRTDLLSAAAGTEDLLDVAARAPVIKLVNLTLLEAIKRRASDVHVQPTEDRLIIRFRVDGVLYDVLEPPKALQEEIISRIKVMGGMNIAERRLAQDGRATAEVGDRVVDLRIATLPTSFGERAVIRLLDKSARLYKLADLGMPDNVLRTFRSLIARDHGIILVTGPTGSGKSTTLYAALQEISAQEYNILTLEDPIEYRLEGISQTQVNEKKGMTFASGLRHVLRQDPDIIMVGEIRDGETARMAIQSALTGHLVFSTLHTNDAAGAVSRMLDLGVEPYLLASCLLGVQAQRLVRRICPKCIRPHQPTAAELESWHLGDKETRPEKLFIGQGCPECLNTGYRERLGIFELLTIDEEIRELILKRSKSSSIKSAGLAANMTTLRADGLAKAAAGVTTMEEVARASSWDEF